MAIHLGPRLSEMNCGTCIYCSAVRAENCWIVKARRELVTCQSEGVGERRSQKRVRRSPKTKSKCKQRFPYPSFSLIFQFYVSLSQLGKPLLAVQCTIQTIYYFDTLKGRRKKEEGRRKKEEGKRPIQPAFCYRFN